MTTKPYDNPCAVTWTTRFTAVMCDLTYVALNEILPM